MIARGPLYANHHTLRGFTIVEALVALVVLAVGMLGIASLYVTTLRASGSATSRMQAVNLAGDLGDRIRANRMGRDAYGAAAAAADLDTCMGAAQTCDAAEMAAHDLAAWQAAIQAALPGAPAGSVAVDTTTIPATYRISVSWQEAAEANPQTYTMSLQI